MLVCEKISYEVGKPILQNIDFSIAEGEIVGIVGKSGAGKTSFLKIISGLIDPTSGKVLFEGKKVIGPSVKLVPGHEDIQLVNQDFALDVYHTVEENIREKILYLPKKEREQFTEELLHLVELEDFRTQKAFEISGGEQQRLSIARALAGEPKLILLDEPFVHLDARLRSKLTNYFLQLRKIRKTSIVLVSHDGSEMLSLADKIFVLKNGKFTRNSTPKKMYYFPKAKEEGQLFGEINSVNLKGKRILFRPDEYEISESKSDETIEVKFDHSLFTGPVLQNYFITVRKEKIVLYSFVSIEHVKYIKIRRKY